MTGNGQGTLWGKKQNTKAFPCANSKDWKSLKEEALSPTLGHWQGRWMETALEEKTTTASTVQQALASAVTLLAPEKIIKF